MNTTVKYSFVFFTGLFFCMQLLFAQQSKDSSRTRYLKNFVQIKADIISFEGGLEWQKKISKSSLIALFGGFIVGRSSDDFMDTKAESIIIPAAFAEYRNNYNLLGRIKKQKKTWNNSANFLFSRIETFFPVKNQNYFNLLISQGWGAQRSICKKIIGDCHLSIIEHFYYDKPPHGGYHYVKVEPHVGCSISYIF